MSATFTIGRVAEAAGCKLQTIRYYEQIGLLPRPARSAGNQRLYDKSNVDRLTFIRRKGARLSAGIRPRPIESRRPSRAVVPEVQGFAGVAEGEDSVA